MSVFRFEEPPAPQSGRPSSHVEAVRALKERPGEWGIVTICSTSASSGSTARAIRTGVRRAWQPAGDFEAVSRKVDGEYRVYARYMPDPDRTGDE